MAPTHSSSPRPRAKSASHLCDNSSSLQETTKIKSRCTPLTSTEKKTTSNGFRLFSKQHPPNISSKIVTNGTVDVECDEVDRMLRLDELRGIVTPCPFVKPLEHRLQAREEPKALRRPSAETKLEQAPSAITIARRRGESIRILTGRKADEDLSAAVEERMQPKDFFGNLVSSSGEHFMKGLQEIKEVARKAAPDAASISMWSYYIHCYSMGQFNIMNPPNPPAYGPNFDFLPAVKPPNEGQRMTLARRYDILWPCWTKEKSGALLRAAMSKFNTAYASFSIFDESCELFKAENGFNQPEIDREMSIAAHMLYTNDILVLLDAQADWRFKGNPLVTGNAGIRFYAGAPLLSAEGLVVGVFAVWSKEPRACFNPDDRRELAEFSTLVMTDLTLQVTKLSDPDLRATPILQRNSLINGIYRPQSTEVSLINLDAINSFGSGLVPRALRYHRTTPPISPTSGVFLENEVQPTSHSLHPTPPPSRGKEKSSLSRNDESMAFAEQDALSSDSSPDSSYHGIAQMLTLQDLRISSPRPFSGSDLTSLHPLPPNTPDRSMSDGELSHQPSFDLDQFPSVPDFSDFDFSRDFAGKVSTTSDMQRGDVISNPHRPSADSLDTDSGFGASATATNGEHGHKVRTSSKSRSHSNGSGSIMSEGPQERHPGGRITFDSTSIKQRTSTCLSEQPTLSSRTSIAPPPRNHVRSQKSRSSVHRRDISRTSGRRSSTSWESSDAAREAALACSSFVQKHGYDLLYVADVKPTRPDLTDEELLKPGGMTKKILAAYGLTQPLDLSSATHLRILRGVGSEHWENNRDYYGEHDYQYGCLIPIHVDDALATEDINSGLVMGIFRKPRPSGNEVRAQDELQQLTEFSELMKGILLRKSVRKSVKRSLTNPSSPVVHAYPANEITEVRIDRNHHISKYSLDSRHTRRFE